MDIDFDAGTITGLAKITSPSTTFTLTNSGTGGDGTFIVQSGTTAQRPLTPNVGGIRYNTDLNKTEYWNGTIWRTDVAKISECTDANIASPVTGQVLTYNGTNWVNSSASSGGSNTAFTANLTSWTNSTGNLYYADVVHSLGTQNVSVTLWDMSSNVMVQADSIVATNTTTCRVTVNGTGHSLRCVVIANGSPIYPIRTLTYYASSLDSPNNADWVVNSLAAAIADPTYNSVTVRQFSNTTEQGVGCLITVPANAVNITFRMKGRAQTAPSSARVVQPNLYFRSIPTNAAMGSWSSAYNMTNIAIPTNAYFQYSSQTYTISALGLSVGGLYQMELTRSATVSGGTNLSTNWLLVELTIEFT